jgi:DNA-binding NtrC family response regulator
VRELKNVIERAASLADGPEITADDLAFHPTGASPPPGPSSGGAGVAYTSTNFKEAKQEVLDRFERKFLSGLIESTEGNISKAAASAGLTRFHLRELLKKHGIGRHGK